MGYKIPFTVLPSKILVKLSKIFLPLVENIEKNTPYLSIHLKQARIKISAKEYISMAIVNDIFIFIFFTLFLGMVLDSTGTEESLVISILLSIFLLLFVASQQMLYPKFFINKRIKNIEKNLLPAMQNTLVQLKSGVPLFHIFAQISLGGYGAVSEEFLKVVRAVNAGKPQADALDMAAFENPSPYFRRVIWQLTNRIKTGSDLSETVKEITINLSGEQIGQIERYGSQLSPLSMFYMVISIIIPSLGLTLLIIIASFMSLSESGIKAIFWGIYASGIFIQFMFIGIMKSRRPNLLLD